MGFANLSANFSACIVAYALGSISPNVNINKVIIPVAIPIPVFPK
jgi:hypothetical protein